ncbi:acyl-CoA dehydrogenase family protein [Nocardioides marmorisolisilvae]|uniref:Acyl-CoA dehydrogenase n=1 Tax=Nocardioides marmorisolisilvae TaxID=1542737 RepID=A0A3N0DV81_9ACTN|nr:acyl-CoA dehydrogenase family protein [Nocardioides marmorisolisilvae]RNL79508.1 acyl-CoA dehydrogenase [Nocardioides marmorisolisilvae]
MHFARTEEQDELAATVRALLTKRSDSAAVRAAIATDAGYDEALWSALCEQVGVAALAVPEEYDGFGASLVETAVVLEVLGEFLTPAPLLASALLAAQTLLHGTDDEKSDLLPRLAAGEVLPFTLGDLVLEPSDRTDAMDQTLRIGAAEQPAATPADVRAIAVALVTALQVGGMQRALDMTVGYTQERVQFGRQIGSFQALKHRMADMLVKVEASRSASWGATAAAAAYLASPGPETLATVERRSAAAGSYCSDAFDLVAAEMVQLHGGIAITWEHDAHLVFKRAHALSQLNGPAHRLRAALLG